MDTSNPPQADSYVDTILFLTSFTYDSGIVSVQLYPRLQLADSYWQLYSYWQLLAFTVAVLVSMVPYYWQLQLLAVIHT